jgi:hypothetical protein
MNSWRTGSIFSETLVCTCRSTRRYNPEDQRRQLMYLYDFILNLLISLLIYFLIVLTLNKGFFSFFKISKNKGCWCCNFAVTKLPAGGTWNVLSQSLSVLSFVLTLVHWTSSRQQLRMLIRRLPCSQYAVSRQRGVEQDWTRLERYNPHRTYTVSICVLCKL